jgi:hypothetical protein
MKTSNNPPKTFGDLSLEKAKNVFGHLLGIQSDSIAIIWNANALKALQAGRKPDSTRTYPYGVLRVQTVGRNENTVFKKNISTYEYGNVAGNSRPALKLLPVSYGLSFRLITDDYRQAFYWANRLLIIRESKELYKKLSFSLSSHKYPSLKIPSQLILVSENYQIQDIEYDESIPMEYFIEGELLLNTRNGLSDMDVELIATFDVYTNTDPDNAVENTDGTTEPLLKTSVGKVLPINLRSNM